jgi:hypothetical protein
MEKLVAFIKNNGGLILISSVAVFSLFWGKGTYIIDTLDLSFPYDSTNYFNRLFYIWNSSNNFGFLDSRIFANLIPYGLYVVIMDTLGVSSSMSQTIFIFLVVLASGLSMYYLTRKLNGSKLAATIAGLFYIVNPFAFTFIWPMRNLFVISYAFVPLAIGHYISICDRIDRNKIPSKDVVVHSLLIFALLTSSLSNPAILLVYLVPVSAYALSLYIKNNRIIYGKIILLTLTIFLLLSAFWVVPFLSSVNSEFENASNKISGNVDDTLFLKNNSKSALDSLNLTGYWALDSGYKGDPYYSWHKDYSITYVYALTFIPIVFFCIYLIFDKKQHIKFFLSFLVIIGVFFLTGLEDVMVSVKETLFQGSSYFTRAVRSLDSKFGPLLLIGLAPAVGLGAMYLRKNYDNRILTSVVFMAIFAYLIIPGKPFFTGDVIHQGGELYPSTKVIVPEYYGEARRYLEKDSVDSKVLGLPLPASYQNAFKWENGFFGTDPTRYLLNRPVLSNNTGEKNFAPPLTIANYANSNSSNSLQNMIRIAGLTNIGYVLFHDDIHWDFIEGNTQWIAADRNNYDNKLERNDDVVRIGDLSFLEVPKESLNELIYMPRHIVKYKGSSISALEAYSDNQFYKESAVLINSNDDKETPRENEYWDIFPTGSDGGEPIEGNINPGLLSEVYYRTDNRIYIKSRIINDNHEIAFFAKVPNLLINDTELLEEQFEIYFLDLPSKNTNQYLKVGGNFFELSNTAHWEELGSFTSDEKDVNFEVYERSVDNLISNGDFSKGLWQQQVSNCSDSRRIDYSMTQELLGHDNDSKALKITSAEDIACTFTPIEKYPDDSLFKIDIKYKSSADNAARFCLWDSTVQKCRLSKSLDRSMDWADYSNISVASEYGEDLLVYLYSMPRSGSSATAIFDSVNISSYKLNNVYEFQHELDQKWRNTTTQPVVEQENSFHEKSNLLINHDFEEGLWHEDLRHCQEPKDKSAVAEQSIVNTGDNRNSILELSTTQHNVCTSTPLKEYSANENYTIEIDYRNIEGESPAVCLWENEIEKCKFNEVLSTKSSSELDSGWYRWRKTFTSSKNIDSARIYLYSSRGIHTTKNQFDNIVIKVADVGIGGAVLARSTNYPLLPATGNINFEKINPTLYNVTINDNDSPYIVFSESYDSRWKAFVMKSDAPITFIDKMLRFFGFWDEYQLPEKYHSEVNSFANGWYISSQALPPEYQSNTGDTKIVLEYMPQRYFYAGSVISVIAIASCLYYIISKSGKNKRKHYTIKHRDDDDLDQGG